MTWNVSTWIPLLGKTISEQRSKCSLSWVVAGKQSSSYQAPKPKALVLQVRVRSTVQRVTHSGVLQLRQKHEDSPGKGGILPRQPVSARLCPISLPEIPPDRRESACVCLARLVDIPPVLCTELQINGAFRPDDLQVRCIDSCQYSHRQPSLISA